MDLPDYGKNLEIQIAKEMRGYDAARKEARRAFWVAIVAAIFAGGSLVVGIIALVK